MKEGEKKDEKEITTYQPGSKTATVYIIVFKQTESRKSINNLIEME